MTPDELEAVAMYEGTGNELWLIRQLSFSPSPIFSWYVAGKLESTYGKTPAKLKKAKREELERLICALAELLPYPIKDSGYPDSVFSILGRVFEIEPGTIKNWYYQKHNAFAKSANPTDYADYIQLVESVIADLD